MGIKTFESREVLKRRLLERNLQFDEAELEKVVISHNYFNLFNGLETIFLDSAMPKSYRGVKLKDFMLLYHFDKELRSKISMCLDDVEEKLKASVAYHFCKRHCATLADTMQYTNKNNYMNPSNGNIGTTTYCRYCNSYPFAKFQNYWIYREFDKFCLFKDSFLSNLVDKKDNIKLSFYQDSRYHAPNDVAVYRNRKGVINPHVAVPFWIVIETLTFGELLRLLHYLQDDVLGDVLSDFGIALSKRTQFLNMIDIILCLRNSCAHTTLMNRFRTEEKYKINALLIKVFDLKPKNSNSVLRLYDVLKILGFFTDVSSLYKPLKKLRRDMITSMGIKKGRNTYNKLLARMGCDEHRAWRKMLHGTKISL